MSAAVRHAPRTIPQPAGDRRLGLALLIIATAQLMLVLDDAIANIALASIQADLDVSAATLPWIITAYVLSFGGLLLFGGRAGDLYGHLRVFRVGVVLFTVASLLDGLAPSGPFLVAARALQGAGAALAAPNALALIASNFPAGPARNRAMAIYGAMSGVGLTGGVLLGGLLTGALSWRWIFLINVPIGIAVLAGTRVLTESARGRGRLEILGAVTGTGGVLALAYGIAHGGEHGWLDGLTIGTLGLAAILLAWFIALQRRSRHPMLPLGLLADRNRTGAYAAMLFIGAGLMGTAFLLTLYMQQVMGFSPIETGFAFLPFSAGIILSQGVSPQLVERLAPRAIAAPGLLLAAVAMFWLSRLSADSSYFGHVLPGVFLVAFGLGLTFVPLTATIVHGVGDGAVGVASAVFNAAQQIGAALGVAVFGSVASAAGADRVAGYTGALLVGAGLLLLAAVIAALAITARRQPELTGA